MHFTNCTCNRCNRGAEIESTQCRALKVVKRKIKETRKMEIIYDKILKEHILETDTFNMILGREKLSDEAVNDAYSKIDSIIENYNRNKKKIFKMVYHRARDFDRSVRLRNIEDLLGKPQYDPICKCVVYYGHVADHMVTVYLKDGEFDKPYSVCLDG